MIINTSKKMFSNKLISNGRCLNNLVRRNLNILGRDKKKTEDELFSIEADRQEEEILVAEKEAEINIRRNKSGLKPWHRNALHGKPPPEPEVDLPHIHELKFKRKLFGKYGNASGVNPGALWPSKDDIEETNSFEKVAYPMSVLEMAEKAREEKRKEMEEILARQKKLEEGVAKMEAWKKEVRDRAAKKLADIEKAKAKKDALIEEVRRHFGYKIDPKDERFKEVLQMKEKESKKKLKEQKAKLRQERLYEQMKKAAGTE